MALISIISEKEGFIMIKKKVVVALGHEALGYNLPEQMQAVKRTAKVLADLMASDYQLIITHSNGPQVSMIHKAMSALCQLYPDYTPAPMSVCSAMSQGYIGYDLQNALRSELLNHGIFMTVSTILTQVTVDPYDEAFYEPKKIIGRLMSKEESAIEEKKGNFVIAEGSEGYRRIVAAPKPIQIVELDAIKALVAAGQAVIACGGGGIPVIEQEHLLKGASAVIEKDQIAGKLADDLDVNQLLILTGVEKVMKNFGKADAQTIDKLTITEAKQLIAEGHFESGSMLPKIEAAIAFVEKDNKRSALITDLHSAAKALKGLTGTLIFS